MVNPTNQLWQNIWYGLLGNKPHIDFSEIPEKIDFISHYDDKNDVHWIEAPQLPEFYVTGKTPEELAHNVADTLLIYYDVPTYFAKKFRPDSIVLNFSNQKTKQEETIRLNYKEELDKALA